MRQGLGMGLRHGLEDGLGLRHGLEAWGREGGMGLRHGGEGWLGLEAWWAIKRERKNQGREGRPNLKKGRRGGQ